MPMVHLTNTVGEIPIPIFEITPPIITDHCDPEICQSNNKGSDVLINTVIPQRGKEIPVRITNRQNQRNDTTKTRMNRNSLINPLSHISVQKSTLCDKNTNLTFLPCFCLLNARSLNPRIDELSIYNVDMVAVTESWLREEIDDDQISIEGFSVHRRDRPHGNGGDKKSSP